MTSQRSKFGGLGAVFFLATLGVIAFHVQQQTIPESRDVLRKPATVAPVASEDPTAPAPLAWRDRLDLEAISLTPFGPTPANTEASATDADPVASRYVQELADGHRILYTLDPVLQQSAKTLFSKREVPYAGAVMLDLRDNSVLAMVGHSTMDPQVTSLEVVATPWAPAASTFKLVTATSLLSHDAATPTTKACFHGGLHGITDDLLRDNPALDDRCETLSSAVAHSFNLVIAKLALGHLDEHQLAKTATALQFEQKIPFDFPVEVSPAHVPSDPISRAKVAAGFWHVDMSPIHGAVLASIYAREGIYQAPHVVDQVIGPEGEELTPERPATTRVLAKDVAGAVGDMMVGTTTEGTARKSFFDPQGVAYIPELTVAGKTGSLTGKRAPGLNYNWFVGFAPAEDPEIAFAVLLANEPKWQIKAHYAARRLVQIYLQRRGAIAEQRAAQLKADALELPRRDPETGVVLANAGEAAKEEKPVEKAAPAEPADKPLPPTPGPLPNVGE